MNANKKHKRNQCPHVSVKFLQGLEFYVDLQSFPPFTLLERLLPHLRATRRSCYFLPVGAISLPQDVAAATRVPTWAGPSEVLDRRVAQWNLGLSGRIVPTSAPTLSWLSVGVAPAAKLTAVILRASRSDFAREPKTHFSVSWFIT